MSDFVLGGVLEHSDSFHRMGIISILGNGHYVLGVNHYMMKAADVSQHMNSAERAPVENFGCTTLSINSYALSMKHNSRSCRVHLMMQVALDSKWFSALMRNE